jgi:hypothetical protein
MRRVSTLLEKLSRLREYPDTRDGLASVEKHRTSADKSLPRRRMDRDEYAKPLVARWQRALPEFGIGPAAEILSAHDSSLRGPIASMNSQYVIAICRQPSARHSVAVVQANWISQAR